MGGFKAGKTRLAEGLVSGAWLRVLSVGGPKGGCKKQNQGKDEIVAVIQRNSSGRK